MIIITLERMEGLFTLFVFYLIAKAIFGGSSKKSTRRIKRRNSWTGSTYSEYDTWSRSHGGKNTLF